MEMRVALDGSGSYRTVQEAIDKIPFNNKQRVVIRIAPGIYKQPIYIPKTKTFITFLGLDAHRTILTWFNTATSIQHHQPETIIGTGTFACGSVIVEGEDFIAENVTFENAAPKGSGQAVAIRVTADRCAFYGCRFLGWQDTAYLHYGRHYFRDCYIEGSVDFIFGNATVLLEYCQIHCKSQGYITAQQRTSETETTGYVFLRCTVTGTGESKPYVYLGRPWGPYARVLFAYTWMDSCVLPAGWNNWDNPQNETTACYLEYRCTGPGNDTTKRVRWARKLNYEEAASYLSPRFIDQQGSWLNINGAQNVPLIPVPLSAASPSTSSKWF
ncbi:unnamed protein product [Calypogeia fissa]